MKQYICDFFKKYFDIKGVSSRKDFWLTTLLYFISLVGIFTFIYETRNFSCMVLLLMPVFFTATIIPLTSLHIRRFNDAGKGMITFFILWCILIFTPDIIENKTNSGALQFVVSLYFLYILIRDTREKKSEEPKYKKIINIILFTFIVAGSVYASVLTLWGGISYCENPRQFNSVQETLPQK
ncbi:MAG: DUF805 domain-containing protein [Alphaproteobacteria bacterium]|nr:DUF805 domain-containing protein [Alphaproteobacteria bacterium]